MIKMFNDFMTQIYYLSKFIEFQEKSTNGIQFLEFDKELLQIKDELNSKEIQTKPSRLPRSRVIEINKTFFETHLPLHEVLIKKGNEYKYVSPFEIPIKYNKKNSYLHFDYLPIDMSEEERCFSHIDLPKKMTENSVSFYAHELAHSQIERNTKILENYFDREVISIFVEKLMCEKCLPKNLETIKIERSKMLKTAINLYYQKIYVDKEKVTGYIARTYIVSTLIANHIFSIYENATTKQKEEILNMCKKIFEGEKIVEEFMEDLSVSYENSKKIKYIK